MQDPHVINVQLGPSMELRLKKHGMIRDLAFLSCVFGFIAYTNVLDKKKSRFDAWIL